MSRILATSTKVVTGNGAPPPTDALLDGLERSTQQFQELQHIVRSVSHQLASVVATGQRIITGVPRQVCFITSSNAFSLTLHACSFLHRERRQTEEDPSPMNTFLNTWARVVDQLRSVQGILGELSTQVGHARNKAETAPVLTRNALQLSRAVGNGTRVLGKRQADTTEDVITGLQRASAELTRYSANVMANKGVDT